MDKALIVELSLTNHRQRKQDNEPLGPVAERRVAFSLVRQQGDGTMYRAMAEECFRWARRAQTEDKRQAYLDVARTWLEAASGQDCGPPAQTPTLWPFNPKH